MTATSTRTRLMLRRSLASAAAALWAMLLLMSASPIWAAPPSAADTVRFLEQATFGPTPDLIAHVQQVGFDTFLQEQFNLRLPDYPNFGLWPQMPPDNCKAECKLHNYTMYPLQARFFRNALTAPDQLRQRVAFALNQIFVVSAQDNALRLPSRMLPYLQILDRQAFGNFRQLLTEITLNPAMGAYLDTAGNRAEAPNENYARELLQLFTIGVNELNPDGTLKLDAQGKPIPTYTQETITAFARVFTGWVLAPPPQTGILNFFDPMVPGGPRSHDKSEKQLLNGVTLPAGRSAEADLQDALDNIFAHSNIAPFISKNLIKHLVTSNPTSAYVGHVAMVFTTTGGDMKSVIRAILLDPEARDSSGANPDAGHLREPVLWITSLLRAFQTTEATTDFVLGESFLPPQFHVGEDLFRSPSVFNFFPPDYVISGESLTGPEFAIQSTSTALARTNFTYAVTYQKLGPSLYMPKGTWLDLSALLPSAGNPSELVNTLNSLMLHGTMTADMHTVIETSVASIPASDPTARVQDAVYLVATSPQYLIER